jgi:hypothetical protein
MLTGQKECSRQPMEAHLQLYGALGRSHTWVAHQRPMKTESQETLLQ